MWSRRAQEYEAKINSGDLIQIAEVVRDLHRSESQPEQSYSERQLYEAALDRFVREIAAVNSSSEPEALKLVELQLGKAGKRAKAAEIEPEIDPEIDEEQEEAA
jgi:CarD family transcriptional regulator